MRVHRATEVVVVVLEWGDACHAPARVNCLAAKHHLAPGERRHQGIAAVVRRDAGEGHHAHFEAVDVERVVVAGGLHFGRLDRREIVPDVVVDDVVLSFPKMLDGIGEDLDLALRDEDGHAHPRRLGGAGGMVAKMVGAEHGEGRKKPLRDRVEPAAGPRVDEDRAARTFHGVDAAALAQHFHVGEYRLPGVQSGHVESSARYAMADTHPLILMRCSAARGRASKDEGAGCFPPATCNDQILVSEQWIWLWPGRLW